MAMFCKCLIFTVALVAFCSTPGFAVEELCGEINDEQVAALAAGLAAYIERTGEVKTRKDWIFDGIKEMALNEILMQQARVSEALLQAEEVKRQAVANAADAQRAAIIEQSEAW